MITALQQLSDEMGDVIAAVGRSLVQVRTYGGGGVGAGTILHPDRLILTNAHVLVHGSHQVSLSDGHTLPARVLSRDDNRDLAALAVDATGLPAIDLGESRNLQSGQWVLALGHPWGVFGAAAAGVVIGTGFESPGAPWSGREWISVSLHMRSGYSGGPLVDIHGRLVGINTMMSGPDVGMAVPVHEAKAFLRQNLGSKNMVL